MAIGSFISLLPSMMSRMASTSWVKMMSGAYHNAWIGLIALHEKQLLRLNQPMQAVTMKVTTLIGSYLRPCQCPPMKVSRGLIESRQKVASDCLQKNHVYQRRQRASIKHPSSIHATCSNVYYRA